MATLVAKNPTTGDQTTKYVYGTTLSDSAIARADLLRAVIYPDSDDAITPLGDGADGIYDRVEYKYNRQGQRTDAKDQNGSVHQYDFDKRGRLLHDRVTTLATGVDGAVRRQSVSYDVRGLVEKQSSYDNATVGSGSVVNQVQFAYNSFAQATTEYQEHGGAVNTSTSVKVQKAFADGSAGHVRPTKATYPNGRILRYEYNSGTDDAISRPSFLADDSSGSVGTHLAEYGYLGLGGIAAEDFTQPQVKLDYDTAADGSFAGFDRFDRVVTHLWHDYGASADRDKFTYGYDRAGNRLYRENAVPSALDEFYTYDNVNRLTISQRGDLNAGKTAISGTPVREEDFTLDMTGNWPTYVQKTSGSTTLNQSRGHNVANEVTSASSWATPAHDRVGNMTTVPKPSSLANGLTLKYDAWNRVVEVKDGNTVVGKYEYDAIGRRVKRHIDSQSPASPNGVDRYEHLFYDGLQVIETRGTTTVSDLAQNVQPKYQYVWSLRYIDAPVLRDENTDTDSLCDDARIYFLNDANMNVTSLVDTAGDALERYGYDPYGRLTIYDATWSATRSTSSYSNTTLYTGRDLDPESGLYFYRARYYSAELGRFVSCDPIEYEAGMNVYQYVEDSPVEATDPSGHGIVIRYPTPPSRRLYTPSGLYAGNLLPWLVPKPYIPNSGTKKTPWRYWLPAHNMVDSDNPIYYGCGGLVAIRADHMMPYNKPGTKCTTVWADALGCLAKDQRASLWPLLIAVQTNHPIAKTATPGCCDIDAINDLGVHSENFLSWLGLTKWQAFWEGASGGARNPDQYVIETTWPNPFNMAQTIFCIVQTPYNISPDVR